MPRKHSEGRTYGKQVAGQPARGPRARFGAIWGLLVPCLMWAGQVVVDLPSANQSCTLVADSTRTENLLVGGQSSARRFLIAVPPLCRVASVALAFDGQTSVAALPCHRAIAPGSEVSRTASFYRERDSGGLAFVECWAGASELSPNVREPGSGRPARLEVSYEPLPQAERAPRERLLSGCTITDSLTLVFSNPADVRAWYSAPETSLSPLFGGDPVPYDFEFAELADVPLRSQVIIVASIGGWGSVPVKGAHDILPIIEGVRDDLSARGVNSILVPYYRTRGGFLGKLRTLSEMFGLHSNNASRLSGEIDRFLSRHPQQRVIMIGLSNGAAFVDGVMQRLSETAQSRVCAIEAGPPLLGPSDADESVLRLDNDGRDPFVLGEYWTIMRTYGWGLCRLGYARLTGQEITQAQAYHFRDHDYSWPAVREEVVGFLDEWSRRETLPRCPDDAKTWRR
jgi:hypothetical protein